MQGAWIAGAEPDSTSEDISVDMGTGTVVIKGPMTPEEKVL
jgi:hypothetical protein